MLVPATPENAAHLLRRAAWGGTPDEIRQVVAEGIEAAVERLFDASAAAELRLPKAEQGLFPYEHEALVAWFAQLAMHSPTPAIEKLLWFWHGHFATSIEKVELPDLLVAHFAALRKWSLGRFDDLLLAIANDAAMNIWLDLEISVVGRPNENFARELLELFTMGASKGYDQPDVVAAARAFTGIRLSMDDVYERPVGTHLNPALHDFGSKTFLGRTGNFGPDDIVAIIVERPECHRFVAERMWLRYAGTEPAQGVIDDLAAAFGARREVKDLVTALFTHPRFYDDEVKEGLVTHPVEVAIRTLRGFDVEVIDVTEYSFAEIDEDEERLFADDALHPGDVSEWMRTLGQVPMLPPNVGGWPHNEAWLDSNRAAGRLLGGTAFGKSLVERRTATSERLRAVAATGAGPLTAELMARFGRATWTAETEAAIGAALGTGPPTETAIAAAFAVAFTSPEVTLA